jgi:Ca-activated chloride channel family protein
VIFLTDGLPSVGELSPERLADRAEARAGRARVFAFGVGHDVNTHLLDRLGEAGRGSTEYVEPGENVERAMGLLAAKIRHPVLTDLSLDGGPVRLVEIYPARIPDVFSGEELVLFGRYQGQGEGRVGVRGERSGSDVRFSTDGDFPSATEANAYLPRLWASRKLGHLSRQIWTEGESASLVEEIRALALRYGLPSPYTSYLVQEPNMVASQGGLRRFEADQARVRQSASSLAPSSAATGAGAVRLAEEARSFRDAASLSNLAGAEAKALDDLQSRIGADEDARVVAGRIFRLEDGVWRDLAHRGSPDVVRVKVFSPAYFRLLSGLTELRPVLGELRHVLVAGEGVSIEVSDSGLEELSDERLTSLVERFRGSHGAP